MFKTGQHVEITSPRLLEILARRKSQPFGTVVAVDPLNTRLKFASLTIQGFKSPSRSTVNNAITLSHLP